MNRNRCNHLTRLIFYRNSNTGYAQDVFFVINRIAIGSNAIEF